MAEQSATPLYQQKDTPMFTPHTSVQKAWRDLRGGFGAVALFSLILNLLMLAGPLYMLQVYDRVLTSQNVDTLIALTILLGGVFSVTGILDLMRTRILNRLGARFELTVGEPVLRAAMRRRIHGKSAAGDTPVEDINGFRDFISGSTLTAFFDAPWIPIYLVILYALHPYLGLLGLGGAATLTILALINNARSQSLMVQAADARGRSDALFRTSERNAELAQSMGMKSDLARRWNVLQRQTHDYKMRAGDRIASFSVLSKTLRMGLQSLTLGLGAALAISGEITPGVMIAATIVLARALAPIDQLIGQWRTFLAARGSYQKINALAADYPEEPLRLNLPHPFVSLTANILQAGPPLAQNATLSGINFSLNAGDVVAVIGPSGSGKSTLAKMIAGIWMPQRGDMKFDGNPTAKWDSAALGQMIGYLPQDVELFDGTIRENIARFSTSIHDENVLTAAISADVHEMINALPDGYETHIGNGFHLSGGQRQRIALARALYNDPFVLVLDEPNSDLDAPGELALRNAIQRAKARGAIVIVMTHRPSTLQAVNKVLILNNGRQTDFGEKRDVLRPTKRDVLDLNQKQQVAAQTAQPQPHGVAQ